MSFIGNCSRCGGPVMTGNGPAKCSKCQSQAKRVPIIETQATVGPQLLNETTNR